MLKTRLSNLVRYAALISCAVWSTSTAQAQEFSKLKDLSQAEFRTMSEDLLSITHYRGVTPANSLGLTGFDVSGELSSTKLNDGSLFKKAGADFSSSLTPRLHVHKGLPMGFDIGGSISGVNNSNIKLIGMEARYAVLSGGLLEPAVAVRAAFSKMSGVSQFNHSSRSLEVIASKGFLNITPYIGTGRIWGNVNPLGQGALVGVDVWATKVFAGANVNLGVINLAAEADKTGNNKTFTVKAGIRW